jgi:hypothetical protein
MTPPRGVAADAMQCSPRQYFVFFETKFLESGVVLEERHD